MAKAAKPTDNQGKTVPAAELVGDHAKTLTTGDQQNAPAITTPAVTDNSTGTLETSQNGSITTTVTTTDEHQLSDFADFPNLPLLAEAFDAFWYEHGTNSLPVIRITAKDDGLRRGGMRHAGTVDHLLSSFTGEQLELILAEPLLTVEFIVAED